MIYLTTSSFPFPMHSHALLCATSTVAKKNKTSELVGPETQFFKILTIQIIHIHLEHTPKSYRLHISLLQIFYV